jgi:O-antigen/teichoic acid export membrane protein
MGMRRQDSRTFRRGARGGLLDGRPSVFHHRRLRPMTDIGLGAADGGLAGRLKRGVAMASIGLVITQVVIIVQTIVLGRVLGPKEVGIFAGGTVVAEFLVVFAQSPLAQALVQRERDIEGAANTVLVVSSVTGLLVGISVLIASPLIGELFHDSRIGLVAAATSGLLFLRSWSAVPIGLIYRAFGFKQRMIIDPSAKVAFASVSIVFAVFGYGAWAMVIGSYASAITELVLNWWMARWRPFRRRFSFRIWREMARFAWPLVLDEMGTQAREMCEQVLVGRRLGTADLGQYRYAYRIGWMPGLAVTQAFSSVLYPAFARIAADRTRFREGFLRALGWIWFAALPVGALLVVAGQPVVVLLLGEKWSSAGAATAAMAGIGPGKALFAVCTVAGRSSLMNWMTALSLGLGVGLVVLLLPFGLIGVGIAISLTYLAVGCLSVELARSVVSASFRDIVSCLAPSTLAAFLAFAVVFPLDRLFVSSYQNTELLRLASVVGECLLFTLVYLCVLRLVSPTRYRSIRDVAHRAVARIPGLTRHMV